MLSLLVKKVYVIVPRNYTRIMTLKGKEKPRQNGMLCNCS